MGNEQFIIWRNIPAVPCIVAVHWVLAIVFCREWVKRDLRDRSCQPLSIRWLYAFRERIWRNRLRYAFKVTYADFRGETHRALCWTPWMRREVIWRDDEIIGERRGDVAS